MTPTKIYDPIPHVAAFGPADEHRNTPGPMVDRLHVFAMLDPSPNYPAARISISHSDIGAMSLTSDQAAHLEERLAQARADVDAVSDAQPPSEGVLTTDQLRCECCGRRMASGTDVVSFVDCGRIATMHAGPCVEHDGRNTLDFSVTHVPTGLRICRAFTRREAWLLVTRLGPRCSGQEYVDLLPKSAAYETVRLIILGVIAEWSPSEVSGEAVDNG